MPIYTDALTELWSPHSRPSPGDAPAIGQPGVEGALEASAKFIHIQELIGTSGGVLCATLYVQLVGHTGNSSLEIEVSFAQQADNCSFCGAANAIISVDLDGVQKNNSRWSSALVIAWVAGVANLRNSEQISVQTLCYLALRYIRTTTAVWSCPTTDWVILWTVGTAGATWQQEVKLEKKDMVF